MFALGVAALCLILSTSSRSLLAENPKEVLAQAHAALDAGEADKAIALLQSLGAWGDGLAEARNLECRVRFMLEQWDAAAQECEKAVRLDGNNSAYHMWLGRALGEKAARASFISAFSLAKRVRSEFEESVSLDPHNAEALSDLGQFYTGAPGVVGGGMSKAEEIASRLDKIDQSRAHQLRAQIAEERKDYGTAEQELHQAIAAAAHPAHLWADLASFYRRRSRIEEMEEAIHQCNLAVSRDRHAGIALYDGAGVLIEARRDPQLAARMLQEYLANPFKTEEGPAFIAEIRLARLKQQLGDVAGAQFDDAAAIRMAHDYKPQEHRH